MSKTPSAVQPNDFDDMLQEMRLEFFFNLIDNRFSIGTLKSALISKLIELAASHIREVDITDGVIIMHQRFTLHQAGLMQKRPPNLPNRGHFGAQISLGDADVRHLDLVNSYLTVLIQKAELKRHRGLRLVALFATFAADTLWEALKEITLSMPYKVDLWPYFASEIEDCLAFWKASQKRGEDTTAC